MELSAHEYYCSHTKNINFNGKTFVPFMNVTEIEDILNKISRQINNHYKEKQTIEDPLIIVGILNGSFMFLADLVKHLNIHCEMHFVKVSSYEGTNTTGTITNIIGLNTDIKNKNVLIVEDIIDTGLTINNILKTLNKEEPNSLDICTLLFKKEKYVGDDIEIKFIGKEIRDDFVIGYGLDYNGAGRQLDQIYALKK